MEKAIVMLFYTTLLDLGYVVLVLAFLLPLVLIFYPESVLLFLFSTLAFAMAAILYLHLSVVWTLALVVSVLEETSGIEALGKAARQVKGLRLKGFLLKLFFGTFSYVMIKLDLGTVNTQYSKTSISINIVIALLILSASCLIKMFSLTTYTVFYYECKKMHIGEEEANEMQSSNSVMGYTKIPAIANITTDIA